MHRPTLAFAPLVFHEWQSVLGLAEARLVRVREVLFAQDEPLQYVWMIERGIIKLVRNDPDGSESILGLRSDGWVLDAPSIILNRPSPYSAVTVTQCEVRRIARSTFIDLLDTNPSLMRDVTRLMCREVQAEQEQQLEFRCGSAHSRLQRLIHELEELQFPGVGDALNRFPLKRIEIAQLLSITPEHLSRLLRVAAIDRDFRDGRHPGALL